MGETAVRPYVPEEAAQAIQQKRKPSVMAALRSGKSSSTPPPMTSPVSATAVPTVGQAPAAAAPTGVLKAAANRLTLGGMNRSRSAPGKSRLAEPVGSQEGSPKPIKAGEKGAAGTDEAIAASIKAKDYASFNDPPATVAPVAVDPTLPQITEMHSDAGSDVGTTGDAEKAATSQADTQTSPPAAVPPAIAVPPRLSDAIMLERGRRVLARQGVDPNVTLRLAQPQSALTPGSPSPAGTPIISVAPAQGPPTPSAGPKGAFKLPKRKLSVPQRSYSGTPRTSNVGSSTVDPPATIPTQISGSAAPLVESPRAADENKGHEQ